MNNNFPDRLNQLRGGLSKNSFARKCDIKQTTMIGYLNGTSEPNLENLIQIAAACNVSVGWLAAGEGGQEARTGDMATAAKTPEIGDEYAAILDMLRNPKQGDYNLKQVMTWLVEEYREKPGEQLLLIIELTKLFPNLQKYLVKKAGEEAETKGFSMDKAAG